MKKKKFLIISGYFKGESYGLLGPQMAATIVNDYTDYDAIVVGVTNDDDLSDLTIALERYFEDDQKIIGFSSLGGRQDLFEYAKQLKDKGAVTVLAGPQAGPDFKGEKGWQSHPHRFQGVSDSFSFALHGPAQQIISFLSSENKKAYSRLNGVLFRNKQGRIVENPPIDWDDHYLSKVDWQTLHILENRSFLPLNITTAQVLQQIGCQHAARKKTISIDYPAALTKGKGAAPSSVKMVQKGCSFCDVASDKGYMGAISEHALKEQLLCVPKGPDGRTIPFELIDESPLFRLPELFKLADKLSIVFSQINLTLRADYLLKGLKPLGEALKTAKKKNVRILLSSIGFESFDDSVLKNLNKGITRQINLAAIKAVRSLKSEFPSNLGYLKEEGANHGFIHPTPWDTADTSYEINKTISMYQLAKDILPNHSTPLIIHHASGLAEWVRRIEVKEKIEFQRIGSTIGWWQTRDKSFL